MENRCGGGHVENISVGPKVLSFFFIKHSHMLHCTILLTQPEKKRISRTKKRKAHEKGENAGRWPSMIRLGLTELDIHLPNIYNQQTGMIYLE